MLRELHTDYTQSKNEQNKRGSETLFLLWWGMKSRQQDSLNTLAYFVPTYKQIEK